MSEIQPVHQEGNPSAEKKIVKLTANLPAEVYADLRGMADKRNTTVTQVLRSAITHERFFMEEVDQGNKILIEREGEVREIVFLP